MIRVTRQVAVSPIELLQANDIAPLPKRTHNKKKRPTIPSARVTPEAGPSNPKRRRTSGVEDEPQVKAELDGGEEDDDRVTFLEASCCECPIVTPCSMTVKIRNKSPCFRIVLQRRRQRRAKPPLNARLHPSPSRQRGRTRLSISLDAITVALIVCDCRETQSPMWRYAVHSSSTQHLLRNINVSQSPCSNLVYPITAARSNVCRTSLCVPTPIVGRTVRKIMIIPINDCIPGLSQLTRVTAVACD